MSNKSNNTSNNSNETGTGTELSTEQVQDVIHRKMGKSDIGMLVDPPTEPGDNARFLRHAMVSLDLPPIDISDPKQVENRIREYFEYCAENDRRPNIKGLGNWLGVDASTVNSWRRGEYRSETHSPIIKKAVDVLEEMWWDFGQNGRMNPASWIFIGKNAFGMRDETQVVVTPNNPLQDLNADEARKRIMDGIPDDEGTVE